jgi:hypothetical protein
MDVESRCRAYLPVMHPRALFSHATAAQLYGLPLPARLDSSTLHVTTIHPLRAPKGRGITGHAVVREPQRLQRLGLPVPSPVEVWTQLAETLSTDELVLVGDAVTRRKGPLADVVDLRAAVEDAHGRRGVTRLREAVALVRARTDSPMETVLRLAIVRAGLPEPLVNYAIVGRDGRTIAHGDLVFARARVVVEYDGDHHRTSKRQYDIDIDRLWAIESLGWRVVRINSTHMTGDARPALARIRATLSSRPDAP